MSQETAMKEKKSSYSLSAFNCPRMEFSPLHMVLKTRKGKKQSKDFKGINPICNNLIQVKTEQVLLRQDAT